MKGYVWKHTDARGFATAFPIALSRAFAGKWSTADGASAETLTADYRNLVASTSFLVNTLSNAGAEPSSDASGTLQLGAPGAGDFTAERLVYARALLATLHHLYIPIAKTANAPNSTGGPQLLYTQLATEEGKPWTAIPVDAGWVQAALIVAGTVVQAAVVVYLIQKGAEVIDRELDRREESKRMVQFHATLEGMLAAHRQREVETFGKENAGKPGYQLPFTEVERATLNALQAAQLAQINAVKKELPSVIPDLKDKGTEVIKAGRDISIAAIAAAAVVAYLLLKGKGA